MLSKWGNKILKETDRHTRAGYLDQMWEEMARVDAKTYAKALERSKKYRPKQPGGVDMVRVYAPDAARGRRRKRQAAEPDAHVGADRCAQTVPTGLGSESQGNPLLP